MPRLEPARPRRHHGHCPSPALRLTLAALPTLLAAAPATQPTLLTREDRAGPVSFVPAGTLLRTTTYYLSADRREIPHGPTIEWFPDGRKRLEAPYRDGLLDGHVLEWSTYTGKVIRDDQWKAGQQDGPSLTFQNDGTKSSECLYRAGKIVGPKRFFNPRGTVVREEAYDDAGNLAELTLFHDNGAKKLHGHFGSPEPDWKFLYGPAANYKRDRTWTLWAPDGHLLAEGTFHDGQPWSGVCGVPQRDNSIITEKWGRYRDGQLLEPLPDPQIAPATPPPTDPPPSK